MEYLLRRLFESWTGPGALDRRLFTGDFIYDCGSNIYTTDVWLDVSKNELPLVDANVLEISGNQGEGRLVFEFVDPVTLLHHKVGWRVTFRDELIAKVSEIYPERRGDRSNKPNAPA